MTGWNKEWLKSLILHFLPFLHNGNYFASGNPTFDIFNNNTFFGTIQKTDEK